MTAPAGKLRIAYITAGAAGNFCGSCLHDNTLVAALQAQGHDALLIPCYAPLHTDEPDVSYRRVFLGGINAYLQQKLALFRHTPRFLDWVLDARPLLRWASGFAVRTQAQAVLDRRAYRHLRRLLVASDSLATAVAGDPLRRRADSQHHCSRAATRSKPSRACATWNTSTTMSASRG